MKNFLLYLFGGVGLGSLLNGVAALAVPDFGGLRIFGVATIAMVIWTPLYRWLTHHDPGPCEETFPPEYFLAPDKHEHRCTKQATGHTGHTCACGMSWQPSALAKPGLISMPDRLTDEQLAAFKAKWEQAHQGSTAHLVKVIDPITGKELPK